MIEVTSFAIQHGVLEAHLLIASPGREPVEYVYRFMETELPDRMAYQIKNNKIFNFNQLRQIAEKAFEYQRIGKSQQDPEWERGLEHIRRIKEDLKGRLTSTRS